MTEPEYISLRTASERYNIPQRTLRGWIYSGQLRAYKVNNFLVRIHVGDLDNLFVPMNGESA